MTWFVVRVELKKKVNNGTSASGADYDKLHAAMEKVGFRRTISADGGTIYNLPTAEYFADVTNDLAGVTQFAKQAADSDWRPNGVFACEISSWKLNDK